MPHGVKPPRRYGGRVTVRVDHWDDPAAPIPTRIVPGGSALVLDDEGRVLLQRRTDSGNWAMPGGVMEIGETLPDAVVRETREETGLEVALTGIVGTFTDPRHVIAYADGEVRQEFTIVFRARPVGGSLARVTGVDRDRLVRARRAGGPADARVHPAAVRLRPGRRRPLPRLRLVVLGLDTQRPRAPREGVRRGLAGCRAMETSAGCARGVAAPCGVGGGRAWRPARRRAAGGTAMRGGWGRAWVGRAADGMRGGGTAAGWLRRGRRAAGGAPGRGRAGWMGAGVRPGADAWGVDGRVAVRPGTDAEAGDGLSWVMAAPVAGGGSSAAGRARSRPGGG